ncbi:hypothetical protein FRC11_010791 [Ceratobasidium sp. 423]|nr:hypothetical protein FRC11_010791 [Ceratobasidium sp. 423]
MPDESDPNHVAWATRRQHVLEPSAEPLPWPNRPGDWYLYEGQTWLLRPLHGTNKWESTSKGTIRRITSRRNNYVVGEVNSLQCVIYKTVVPLPVHCHSALQCRVYDFVCHLSTTTHPLAPWNQVVYGIRRDSHGVWSQYDVTAYKFLTRLTALNTSTPRNEGQEHMLSLAFAILRKPGCYARLISIFYPNVRPLPLNDPLDVTHLDSSRGFNTSRFDGVTTRTVVYYLWEVLKIPRQAAQQILEPYVQLSSIIQSAVTVWLGMTDMAVADALPISYHSSMTRAQSEAGTLFLAKDKLVYDCGPCPLEDEERHAVIWRLPTPAEQPKVSHISVHTGWIEPDLREQFLDQWEARVNALGKFEFM